MGSYQQPSKRSFFFSHTVRKITILSFLIIGNSLQAQEDESFRRVSFGVRAGGNVLSPMDVTESTLTEIDGTPALDVSTEASSDAGRFFIGPTVQFNVTRDWAFEADLLTRSAGYRLDSSTRTVGSDDDPAEFVRSEIDTVDFRYWDVPLLVKRYFGDPSKARAYISGGISLRATSGASGERQTLLPEDFEPDEDGIIDPVGVTESFAPEFARTSAVGAVAAFGVEGADDFGIKLSLEGRYTRWFGNVLDVGFVRSSASQLEVVAGLSF